MNAVPQPSTRRLFTGRPPGEPGLALFLNAGDPPLDVLRDVVTTLDEAGVDCLELAVPFPDSFTDGPVIRRSARRALDHGVGLTETLDFVDDVRPNLRRLRITLLADWSHTVRPVTLPGFLDRVAASGADALLLHGLPPAQRQRYHESALDLGLPIVTTCYASSDEAVMADSARNATGYLYLVAHYGRSGTAPRGDHTSVAPAIARLHDLTGAPIAVGFGVTGRADVRALHGAGADAVVIGSAAVARVERAMTDRRDVAATLLAFVDEIRPIRETQQERGA
ncbi:tryptophan synthase subunit alpha [Actinomadura meridiana]|uniref:Tryptophan synthase alpha chain n=1 Tax=Actinomadura meridiana TaxID=559626 RepID=A0ABP8CFF7_9ACTN